MANPTPRDQVFISYSRKDRKILQQLQVALKPLVSGKKISVWDDTRIKAGDEWRNEVKRAIASAKVAVLLVSPDFLASDFIAEHELPPLLEAARNEGLRILWVAVRHSLYEETEIARYQAVSDPTRPIANLSATRRDKEIIRICGEILSAATLTNTEKPQTQNSANEDFTVNGHLDGTASSAPVSQPLRKGKFFFIRKKIFWLPIAGVGFIIIAQTLFIYWYPQISISPVTYKTSAASRMPFIVTNQSHLPIYDVQFDCNFKTYDNKDDCPDHAFAPSELNELSVNRQATLMCFCYAGYFQEKWPSSSASPLTISVSYRPKFMPYRKEEKVRYFVRRSQDGELSFLPFP